MSAGDEYVEGIAARQRRQNAPAAAAGTDLHRAVKYIFVAGALLRERISKASLKKLAGTGARV